MMTSLDRIFDDAAPHGHVVQFYKADEPLLNRNVGQFLWEGLLRGDGLLVIAAPERRESVTSHLRRLGVDIPLAVRERKLLLLDAQETLDRFMVDGQPDWGLFRQVVCDALQVVRPRTGKALVRAYGEMVGVLWEAEEYTAAILLEEHWNRLLHDDRVVLFCGYPIDIFAEGFERSRIEALLSAHTHCVSAGSDGDLDCAMHQAMEEVLGQNAAAIRVNMSASSAQDRILWLRHNLPVEAGGILSLARTYYQASQLSAD
jgi:hypothetical protein